MDELVKLRSQIQDGRPCSGDHTINRIPEADSFERERYTITCAEQGVFADFLVSDSNEAKLIVESAMERHLRKVIEAKALDLIERMEKSGVQPPGEHDWLRAYVTDVPDWPKPGITFKDITPLLANTAALEYVCKKMRPPIAFTKIVALEARGFLFATPLAINASAPLVPARKFGKLPRAVETVQCTLEYGTASINVHQDAINPGDQVLIVDDVLATGGTAQAAAECVRRLGGNVVAFSFLMELSFLGGRARLWQDFQVPAYSLISYG